MYKYNWNGNEASMIGC